MIFAVFCQPDTDGLLPAVILCHGTASCKNEVGNLFIHLARSLAEKGLLPFALILLVAVRALQGSKILHLQKLTIRKGSFISASTKSRCRQNRYLRL